MAGGGQAPSSYACSGGHLGNPARGTSSLGVGHTLGTSLSPIGTGRHSFGPSQQQPTGSGQLGPHGNRLQLPIGSGQLGSQSTGHASSIQYSQSSPRSRPTTNAGLDFWSTRGGSSSYLQSSQVESLQENRFVGEVMSMPLAARPSLGTSLQPAMPAALALPQGGRYDRLLDPGQAMQLCTKLADIFRGDAPGDSGRTNGQTCGLGCGQAGRYGQEVFSAGAIAKLLSTASGFWDKSPSANIETLRPTKRFIICGDTHGQLEDVLWIFFKYGIPSSMNQYIFNGDICDRGGHALEIFLLLFSFKRDDPTSVYINRGNHEDAVVCCTYGFRAELMSKFPDAGGLLLRVFIEDIFPCLPLGALIVHNSESCCAFVAHGGLPALDGQQSAASIGDLRKIDRVKLQTCAGSEDVAGKLVFNLLWGDATEDPTQRGQNQFGRGNKFTEEDTRRFCQHNKVSCFIRSHEVPSGGRGFESLHSFLCHTVFSASNYTGNQGNRGGVIIIKSTEARPIAMEHWAPTFLKLAELLSVTNHEKRVAAIDAWEAAFGVASSERTYCAAGGHGQRSESKNTTNSAEFGRELSPGPDPRNRGLLANQSPTMQSPTVSSSKGEEKGAAHAYPSESANNISQTASSRINSPRMSNYPNEAFNSKKEITSASSEQVLKFIVDQIVEHSDVLLREFIKFDVKHCGTVTLKEWESVMKSVLGSCCSQLLEGNLLSNLAITWNLCENITYLDFLHRFQIDSEGYNVDRKSAIEDIRVATLDIPLNEVQRLLDPNSDTTVTMQEFVEFLSRCRAQVSTYSAGLLYTTMCGMVHSTTLSTDNMLLCLSVMREGIRPHNAMADFVSEAIRKSGKSFVQVFKEWDQNASGFLSAIELKAGLSTIGKVTDEQVLGLMSYMESAGVKNNRIDVLEFLGAVAPRSFAINLNSAMSKEILIHVWKWRDNLRATLTQFYDRGFTNKVTVKQFAECLQKMNGFIEQKGQQVLNSFEIQAVCEIASKGASEFNYETFIESMRVVDRHQDIVRRRSSACDQLAAASASKAIPR